jgi:GNAT superfamily N-acetyltransferase
MAERLYRTDGVTLAKLEASDVEAAQRVLNDAPAYHRLVLGKVADPQMAKRCFEMKPPAPRHGLKVWKYMVGIYGPDEAQLLGLMDVFVGFPRYDVATLATFVLKEGQQRRGWGGKAIDALATWMKGAHPATLWIDVTITDDNIPATHFLLGHGFERTDTWDKVELEGRTRRVIRLERALKAASGGAPPTR